MGICWGSPDFPTPSFRPSFPHDIDLTMSSSSDPASSPMANSCASSLDGTVLANSSSSHEQLKQLRVFRYAELKAMTKNFSSALGETHFDGMDIVHCGWIEAGAVVMKTAVKVIEYPRKPSRLQRSIMRAKVESYGSLHHPNVARSLGYCLKGRKLLLVYEIPGNHFSLEDHLYKGAPDIVDKGKAAALPLPWYRRLQIAVDATKGLSYLSMMNHAFPQYFQASYVFLDKLYAVKIAPFNLLVTESSDSAGRKSKVIVGIETGNLLATERRRQAVNDLGVILLELLTGLALGRNRWSPEYGSRIEWIKTRVLDSDKIVSLMDCNMGSYPLDSALEVAQLAVYCLGKVPPTLTQVEEKLRQIKGSEISFPTLEALK
ncbi:hypothetical protein SAY86_028091 [Trapa natans]|uniref:Protein kinase domain-containing protein n=1 Tax=Trapa natans TaxID=22666 RepID=A0AAN7LZ39_TRANT|nr:hypothetical protein SAY86_028091 [Trapa natans]